MRDLRALQTGIVNLRRPARFVGGTARFPELRLVGPLALILLCFGLASSSAAQITFANTPLRVSPHGELTRFWQVLQAGLREDADATTGYLEVQNISGATVDGAIFYVEYFDARGRFCFSLAFAQATNTAAKGPIAPAEVRELYSSGSGLFTASEPKEARIYLVRQSTSEQADSPLNWDVSFGAPVTLSGGVRSEASELQLGPELALAKGPFLDLVLAKVSVDEKGFADRVDVLNTASKQVGSWFLDFARRQLTLYPATDGAQPKPDQALILVRVILSEEGLPGSPFLPRMSPWVKSYVARLTGTEVPFVTGVVFARPTGKVNLAGSHEWVERLPAPLGAFELRLLGSYWSEPAFGWVSDPSMPHRMRRELAVPHSR